MKKRIITLSLFISCIGINLYFRIIPAQLPQLKSRAKKELEKNFLQNVYKLIEKNYSQFSPLVKKELIKMAIKRMKKEGAKEFREMVKKRYRVLKDYFQDENGQTYLLGADSYEWLRRVENILKNRCPGKKRIGRLIYYEYLLAPLGLLSEPVTDFFFYPSAYLYKIFNFFKKISLYKFIFWLPLFYSFIFLTIVYLGIKELSNDLGAFFGTLFIGLNGFILKRSCVGWFDYDTMLMTLPLIIVFLLYFSFKKNAKRIKFVLYPVLASLTFGILSSWRLGYWWIFVVIVGFYFYSIINFYLINKRLSEEIKKYLISFGIFLIGSSVFCYILYHINIFTDIFFKIKENLNLGTPLKISIWPNVYYTVAELKKASSQEIAKALYGKFICIFSLFIALYLFIKERRSEKKDIVCMMILWMMFMIPASYKAIRFVGFLSIPLGIFFGVFVGEISSQIINVNYFKDLKKNWLGVCFSLFLLYAGFKFLKYAFKDMFSLYPTMNDSWYKALNYVKDHTPPHSIINSWWDYGNFFKTIGKRRVIFDGQTQNRPLAYWMAQVLLSNNEEKALRILRMMNNSSDRLFFILNRYIKNPFECIIFLKELLNSDREKAKYMLEKAKVPSHVNEKVLKILFGVPQPAYFIVDKSMISKIPSISFLGNWDFRKVYIEKSISAHKKREEILKGLKEIFKLKEKEAELLFEEMALIVGSKDFYESLSHRNRFYSSLSKGERKDDLVYFDNGLVYNLNSDYAIFFSPQIGEYKTLKSIFVFKDGKFKKIEFKDSDSFISALIILKENEYKSIFLDEELGKSLLVRLYFLKGEGLKYFEPFYLDDKNGIYIFKIKWK